MNRFATKISIKLASLILLSLWVNTNVSAAVFTIVSDDRRVTSQGDEFGPESYTFRNYQDSYIDAENGMLGGEGVGDSYFGITDYWGNFSTFDIVFSVDERSIMTIEGTLEAAVFSSSTSTAGILLNYASANDLEESPLFRAFASADPYSNSWHHEFNETIELMAGEYRLFAFTHPPVYTAAGSAGWSFQSTVTPVPLPGSIALYFVSLILLGYIKNFRRHWFL